MLACSPPKPTAGEWKRPRVPPEADWKQYLDAPLAKCLRPDQTGRYFWCYAKSCDRFRCLSEAEARRHNATHHSPACADSRADRKADRDQILYISDALNNNYYTFECMICEKSNANEWESHRTLLDHLRSVHANSIDVIDA